VCHLLLSATPSCSELSNDSTNKLSYLQMFSSCVVIKFRLKITWEAKHLQRSQF